MSGRGRHEERTGGPKREGGRVRESGGGVERGVDGRGQNEMQLFIFKLNQLDVDRLVSLKR